MINYKKGSLFESNEKYLGHACNAQGVWGGGIALEFRKQFPRSYSQYKYWCSLGNTTGTSYITAENVVCLITSSGFGFELDPPETIIAHTRAAIADLYSRGIRQLDIPKINAGLFNVPWEQTEAVLKEFPDIQFNVWC